MLLRGSGQAGSEGAECLNTGCPQVAKRQNTACPLQFETSNFKLSHRNQETIHMARIRTIKPEFFTSEDIVSLSPLTRLLYIAIWCEADKEGRLVWKPMTFKLRYFPADNCDIQAMCTEIVQAGLVVLYGNGYAYVPSFNKHQHINPRESVSTLPVPPDFVPGSPRKITQDVRAEVMERDSYKCVRCNATEDLTLDHILPQSLGGPHVAANLRVMCRSCNCGRPVSGQAFLDDLALDGFTLQSLRVKLGIDASPRVGTRANQKLHAQGGREGKGKEGDTRDATPDGVSDSVWQDFQKLRKAKKAPITDTALNGIRLEAEKAGMSLGDALAMCCKRGWQGFEAAWVTSSDHAKQNQFAGAL